MLGGLRVKKFCLLGSCGHGCRWSDSGLINKLEPSLKTLRISGCVVFSVWVDSWSLSFMNSKFTRKLLDLWLVIISCLGPGCKEFGDYIVASSDCCKTSRFPSSIGCTHTWMSVLHQSKTTILLRLDDQNMPHALIMLIKLLQIYGCDRFAETSWALLQSIWQVLVVKTRLQYCKYYKSRPHHILAH